MLFSIFRVQRAASRRVGCPRARRRAGMSPAAARAERLAGRRPRRRARATCSETESVDGVQILKFLY